MLSAIVCFQLLLIILAGLAILTLRHVLYRLDNVADAIVRLQQANLNPAVKGAGGRSWPTPDELTAARNRIDVTGVARSGEPM